MKRREFLTRSGFLLGGLPMLSRWQSALGQSAPAAPELAKKPEPRIEFETSDSQYQKTYAGALDVLARNTTTVSGYTQPVLIEGSSYSGIWLECAPQEGLVYSVIRPERRAQQSSGVFRSAA